MECGRVWVHAWYLHHVRIILLHSHLERMWCLLLVALHLRRGIVPSLLIVILPFVELLASLVILPSLIILPLVIVHFVHLVVLAVVVLAPAIVAVAANS